MKSYTLNIPHFEYPESFQKIVELNLVDFDIWHLLDSHWAAELYRGLQTRYPNRKLIPFASPGWEQRQEFPDCWAWFAQAVNDMIEYNRESGIM